MPSPLIRFWLPLMLASLYAWMRGGSPERTAAAIFVSACISTHVLSRADLFARFDRVDPILLMIDLGCAAGLLLLTLRTHRSWLMLMTALQIVATLGHLGKLMNPRVLAMGYALAEMLPAYPMIALLAIGTYLHQRRQRSGMINRS